MPQVKNAKCDSSYAMGALQPDPKDDVTPFGDGVLVPSGKAVERQLEGGHLRHNGECPGDLAGLSLWSCAYAG
jgi:hypothetical protein